MNKPRFVRRTVQAALIVTMAAIVSLANVNPAAAGIGTDNADAYWSDVTAAGASASASVLSTDGVITPDCKIGGNCPPNNPPKPPNPPVPPPLDCRTVSNSMQTYIDPFGARAMSFSFYMEYCYNSARDLVRVSPFPLPPVIQLPAEEIARGYAVGWIGTITINAIVPAMPVVTESGTPVRTSQGEVYHGVYTINATFVPNLGAAIPRPQTAQATIGVIIDNVRAYPTPPLFIRLT